MITSAFKNYLWNFQKILIQKAQLRRAATYEVFLTHFWSVVVATQTKARPVVYKQQRQKFFLLQIQLLLTSITCDYKTFFTARTQHQPVGDAARLPAANQTGPGPGRGPAPNRHQVEGEGAERSAAAEPKRPQNGTSDRLVQFP